MSVSIPPYPDFMHPLLLVLSRSPEGLTSRDASEQVADYIGLTVEQRRQMLESGRQEIYRNRIGWAHDRLKRQNLSGSPKRGFWRISELGRKLLSEHPSSFPDVLIKEITAVPREANKASADSSKVSVDDEAALDLPPDELVDRGLKTIRATVAEELLSALHDVTPERFEIIVLDVIHALGYGLSREDLAHVGRSADAGIDGVVSLDKLGLDKIYVQAKKWTNASISRPEIQAFYGALAGQRARRGVFITTSTFSEPAKNYVANIDANIVLIDGPRLVQLMIDLEIGVTHKIIRRPHLDTDYFDVDA